MALENIIANLCQIALDVAPDDAVIVEARDLAREGRLTTDVFTRLRDQVAQLASQGRGDWLWPISRDLERIADPDDVPVTVAELRDTDNGAIWRVTNAAGTVLYAWVDARGWECTGWALGSFLDDVEPITGHEDVPRGQWPVGLAQLVVKALADIGSEPDTWSKP